MHVKLQCFPNRYQVRSGQVRSGQVRVFNVHIQSKLLYRTPVTGTDTGLRRFLCPVQGKKGEGVREGPTALAGTKEYKLSDQGR